jgi:hypothetical protein
MNSAKQSTDRMTPFARWLNGWRYWKELAWRELGKALILPVTDNNAVRYVLKYVTKPARAISWMEVTPQPTTPEHLWGIVTQEGLVREVTEELTHEQYRDLIHWVKQANDWVKQAKGRMDHGEADNA